MTLSPAAERFLRVRVASLLHLDVLLLLRQDPSRWCSATAIGAALRVSRDSAERALEQLGAENFVDVKIASDVLYRFSPLDPGVEPILTEVASAHYQSRETVESLVGARGRSDAARRLADAFRLRVEDDNG